jgi:nucleotide-binding universal stress UspA family protein
MTTESNLNWPIVVGVDGSTSATYAVRWAARAAARRKAPLSIVHFWDVVPMSRSYALALPVSYVEAVQDEGRQWLDAAAAAAREVAPDVAVSTELSRGSAAGQLIGRSASAELVVLGSRGLGGFTGLLVGSIAVAVATHGHCPVVVVRGSRPDVEPSTDGPVVVGVDGSRTSEAAIPFAFEAAASRDAPLVAVHTWMDLAVEGAWGMPMDEAGWESVKAEELELLGERLAECTKAYPGVSVQRVVTRDRPAHTLLDHAKTAQLVVVGSRGRGGFRGLLLGSTSQALIYHATCPVAVVPPPRP